LAVCGSNLLKLGGCLHLTLIHNPEFFCVDLIICLCFMEINKRRNFFKILLLGVFKHVNGRL
jgi:hypothetical protein